MSNVNETNQMWRDYKEQRKAERLKAAAALRDELDKLGLTYRQYNDGLQIRFSYLGTTFDMWPTTARWKVLGGTKKGFGLDNLMACAAKRQKTVQVEKANETIRELAYAERRSR